MRVFVTGATGVIAERAVPALVALGHVVVGLTRSSSGATWLRDLGAEPTSLSLFDPEAVTEATKGVDAIVHLATAIPSLAKMAHAESWADNDRLRTEASRNLVDAAITNAVAVVIVESITMNYLDRGADWIDEESPVRPMFQATASALVAEREAARFASEGGKGISLRMSQLYGPGRTSAELVQAISAGRVPLVGHGENFVSNLHAHDAGSAVVAALDLPTGVYNVSDNAPVTSAERLRLQAAGLGAPPPRRVSPAKADEGSANNILTVSHRISSRRFRNATGWSPSYPSIREGWATVTEA